MTTTLPTREISTQFKDGKVYAQSSLSPEGFPVRALVKLYPRLVIPIIFVPGVMGTNLRVKGGTKRAWRAPNGVLMGLIEVIRYLGQDAATRKKVLDPKATEVDDDGPVEVWSNVEKQLMGDGDPATLAKLRGWGELHQESYASILNSLQDNLSNILKDGELPSDYWQEHVLQAQHEHKFGAEKEFAPLTAEELKRFARAAYPVHAVGFNWLQCNTQSATRLIEKIDGIIDYYRTQMKKDCEQVILITHSMGGLASRASAQLRNSDKVLGVLHGVMPAIGAPAAYKRMRAGFEGIAQVLLGRNAAETTAVLAQSPGPLQLLPTQEYQAKHGHSGHHWLRAHYQPRNSKHPLVSEQSAFLGEGNPYDAIYLNRADWWRLIKVELINPQTEARFQTPIDGFESFRVQEVSKPKDEAADFAAYRQNLEKARAFHHAIKGQYHPNCFAYYAADVKQLTWGEVRWQASHAHPQYADGQLRADDLNGRVEIQFGDQTCVFEIAEPDTPGDGTVPQVCGEAPKPYIKQIFRHEGAAKGHPSYEHQYSYKTEFTTALTLYSIAKLTLMSKRLDGIDHE